MRTIAAQYLRQLFQPDDKIALTLIKKRTSEALQRIAFAFDIASDRWQNWLRFKNSEGFEIYCTMNTLTPTARNRDKSDIQDIRHVYLDFDADGTAALARLRLRTDLPPPNYIVNTSPGKFQVTWRVIGFTLLDAERLLRALARDAGADIAVTDVTRVLRLPGFHNHKYTPAHFVTLQTLHTSAVHPEAFPSLPDPDLAYTFTYPPLTPFPTSAAASTTGDGSRSGQDWRTTLSRLRLGADASSLIRDLAAARPDKPKPLDYATRTVRRAQALIKQTPPRLHTPHQ